MRKTICILLSVILILMMPLSAAATEYSPLSANTFIGNTDNAIQKKQFAQEMDSYYKSLNANHKATTYSTDNVDQLILNATLATGVQKETILNELETYGVFFFESSNQNSFVMPCSDISDVIVYAPEVYYNTSTQEWILSCAGNWLTDNWQTEATSGNVGGYDAFGFNFINTSGSTNFNVKRYSAYLYDQNFLNYKYTSISSNDNYTAGTVFKLQDTVNNNSYIGYRWVGSCTYDKSFENYSGNVIGFYIHTWNNTSISSISVSSNKDGLGVSYTLTSNSNFFEGYGPSISFG